MIGSTMHLPTSSTSSHLSTERAANQLSINPNNGASSSSLVGQHMQPQPHTSASYPEDFYANPGDVGDAGQTEHYIYVTYPPELKRRLLERYGKDIYLMLLEKDGCK